MNVQTHLNAVPNLTVMAGLVPALHVFQRAKAWIPGTSPGMTMMREA